MPPVKLPVGELRHADSRPRAVVVAVSMAVLTFAIPAAQWLVGQGLTSAPYGSIIGSGLVILGACIWGASTNSMPVWPASWSWRLFCCGVGTVALGLVGVHLRRAPVSSMTGLPRSPFEVLDTLVFGPLAEEWVFRGWLWAIVGRLSKRGDRRWVALAVTSLLFAAGHVGYWAQSGDLWRRGAALHVLSMVPAGVCFGALRLVSGSLAVPFVVHAMVNGAIVLTQ